MRGLGWAGLTAAALAGACDSDPTALPRVNEIRLSPADTTVEHPDSFRYDVELLDAAGDPILDPRPIQFSTLDFAVLTVSSAGYVRTNEAGAAQVLAQSGGTTGTANLIVTDIQPDLVE